MKKKHALYIGSGITILTGMALVKAITHMLNYVVVTALGMK